MLGRKQWILAAVALFSAHESAFAQDWGNLERLVDFTERKQPIVNLRLIESMGLGTHELSERPWSDSFWPDVKGSIAVPYIDGGFLSPLGWQSLSPNRSKLHGRSAAYLEQAITDTFSDTQLNNMAPSEKYDYLLGDKNFTLTNQVIKMVDQRSDMDLTTYWTGVCHGWSPAALKLPRPQHSFEITAANGRKITFYPADVKALASFLWGKTNAQASTKVEGWQCQTGASTNKHGRLIDPRCFDVNPSFLHLAMINLIGLENRGFIMDRNYRGEVQNQPVFKYSVSYFDPTRRRPSSTKSFSEAKVVYSRRFADPFRPFRSPKIKGLVGVELKLWYMKENGPNHLATDGPSNDKYTEFKTRYDLELDENDNIVGGEWREFDSTTSKTLVEQLMYNHPDMIWLPSKNLKAFSVADPIEVWTGEGEPTAEFLSRTANQPKWDGKGAAPQEWLEAQLKASIKSAKFQVFENQRKDMLAPMPVASIVDMLIARSRE